MSTNDQGLIIEDELTNEVDFTEGELNDETIDWKAKALELKGLNKRRATKLAKAKEAFAKPKSEPTPTVEKVLEKTEFDYGELAFIASKGIPDEEVSFVWDTVKNTGKSLKELLATTWFQKDLKEKRELKVSKEAIPPSTKRASTGSTDNVEHWLAKAEKGEFPSDPKLRREVAKALIARDNPTKNKFSSNPIV